MFAHYTPKSSHKNEEKFKVGVGDVVFVPTENKFAVEGKMEYITVDNPAFFMEQSEEIKA
jgi:mannose-6-phosphate isomerase-like protein (cupin superfamily)